MHVVPSTVYATEIHFVKCGHNSCLFLFYLCRVSYQVTSRGLAVMGGEKRKFITKETGTTRGPVGRIREVC